MKGRSREGEDLIPSVLHMHEEVGRGPSCSLGHLTPVRTSASCFHLQVCIHPLIKKRARSTFTCHSSTTLLPFWFLSWVGKLHKLRGRELRCNSCSGHLTPVHNPWFLIPLQLLLLCGKVPVFKSSQYNYPSIASRVVGTCFWERPPCCP